MTEKEIYEKKKDKVVAAEEGTDKQVTVDTLTEVQTGDSTEEVISGDGDDETEPLKDSLNDDPEKKEDPGSSGS